MTKLRAFWNYDLFPYVASGEVGEDVGDGCVRIKDEVFVVRYVAMLPLKMGNRLKKELDSLRAERRQAERDLRRRYVKKAIKLLRSYAIDPKHFKYIKVEE